MAEAPSFLAVLVDCSSTAWAHRPEALERLVEQLLFFVNAYNILAAGNQLLVIGFHPTEVCTVWPEPIYGAAEAAATPAEPPKLRASLLATMQRLLSLPLTYVQPSGSRLSAALALSLCRMQRARRSDPKLQLRALVLQVLSPPR